MAKRKFYVVWEGRQPGIYEDWGDCLEQVDGFPGAKYKSYSSQTEATLAFRAGNAKEADLILGIAARRAQALPVIGDIPEIDGNAIAVDGACAGNPGMMEYRGVEVGSGKELFHVGPLPDGTNNVAEYLALIHALAYLHQKGDTKTPIYSDSKIARAWIRDRGCRTKLERTDRNGKIFELLARANIWIQSHTIQNPILRWDTDNWGEIPADFGRK